MTDVLLVEDDDVVRRALTLTLGARGYHVRATPDGASAMREAASKHVDLVVLDLGLPDIDGVELVARLRALGPMPIVVLSARQDQSDKVRALDAGADDYVTKPFGIEELLARLRAAVRRSTPAPGSPTVITAHFTVDLRRKEVARTDGTAVHLTPTEWSLLEALAREPGVVVESATLLREVWGPSYGSETNYLRVYMAQLRKKLEPDPSRPVHLITTAGIGYRFEA